MFSKASRLNDKHRKQEGGLVKGLGEKGKPYQDEHVLGNQSPLHFGKDAAYPKKEAAKVLLLLRGTKEES